MTTQTETKKVLITLHYNTFNVATVMVGEYINGEVDFMNRKHSMYNLNVTVNRYKELGYEVEVQEDMQRNGKRIQK